MWQRLYKNNQSVITKIIFVVRPLSHFSLPEWFTINKDYQTYCSYLPWKQIAILFCYFVPLKLKIHLIRSISRYQPLLPVIFSYYMKAYIYLVTFTNYEQRKQEIKLKLGYLYVHYVHNILYFLSFVPHVTLYYYSIDHIKPQCIAFTRKNRKEICNFYQDGYSV